jgi:NAD(P)-dependent dehydrogenase (short-subunit alcohol dehydrogenase family)
MGALTKKVIVVVGGTTGLGLSAARAFVREGARVVVVGRNEKNVRIAARRLGRHGRALAGNAADPETTPGAIAEAIRVFGGFHGLYHVAGGSGRRQGDGPLHKITDEGWEQTIRLNLTTLFYANRAAVRAFLKRRTGGSILNMGSVLGFSPSPRYFATHSYAAAKASAIGLVRSAAARYASDGIRFNLLAPALVATPMSRRAQTDDEILRYIATKQPLDGGRIGRPEDLDAAAVYFMSDASSFVTGQVLAVDGGWSVSEGQFGRRERRAKRR